MKMKTVRKYEYPGEGKDRSKTFKKTNRMARPMTGAAEKRLVMKKVAQMSRVKESRFENPRRKK